MRLGSRRRACPTGMGPAGGLPCIRPAEHGWHASLALEHQQHLHARGRHAEHEDQGCVLAGVQRWLSKHALPALGTDGKDGMPPPSIDMSALALALRDDSFSAARVSSTSTAAPARSASSTPAITTTMSVPPCPFPESPPAAIAEACTCCGPFHSTTCDYLFGWHDIVRVLRMCWHDTVERLGGGELDALHQCLAARSRHTACNEGGKGWEHCTYGKQGLNRGLEVCTKGPRWSRLASHKGKAAHCLHALSRDVGGGRPS